MNAFTHGYGDTPIVTKRKRSVVKERVVAKSVQERTKALLAHCKGAINIASQEANDRSRSITPRRIGV